MAQLLYIVASLHVLLCSFTKVEESFNIQAIHDILYHRHNLSDYDHNEFPGVVPRTFIGPLFISALSAPFAALFYITGINKYWIQVVARLTLALTVIGAWTKLRNTLQIQYGHAFAWWYTVITATQYHFMFYMSRTLPNIMVMPLVLLAFEGWISNKYKQFIVMAGASIIMFRSELAMLFGLFLIIDIYFKKIDIQLLVKTVVPAGVGLVVLTVIVDSVFWGRLVWPEAEVFWFNTIMNKSSNWGTSPFLWYIYSALPRGLGPSIVLIPVGLYLDRRFLAVAAPALTYILLYSFLPHKELRFIIYVFPLLNMASAAACSYVFIRRSKAPIFELLFWGTVVIIVGNIVLSVAFVSVAATNYPGGVAINRFHKLLKDEPFAHLHICNLAAQTGVTRFTQINDNWKYSKNESLQPEDMQEFTHLLIEAKSKYSPSIKAFSQTHVILDSIDSFAQVSLNYKLIPPIKIKTKPAIFILERKDFRDYPQKRGIAIDGMYSSEDSAADISAEDFSDGSATIDASGSYIDKEFDHVEPFTEPIKKAEIEEFAETEQHGQEQENIVEYKDEENENLDEANQSNENSDKILNDDSAEKETKMLKTKKILEELKTLRQERKQKASAKIKSETRKKVAASAKERLRELMKKHKQIAEQLSENVIADVKEEEKEEDGRGDIPETNEDQEMNLEDIITNEITLEDQTKSELIDENELIKDDEQNSYVESRTDNNIDTIVEEVIHRLIERKIYDDKTKPEDIKIEDRQVIQQIVEEVLNEKMNYANIETK